MRSSAHSPRRPGALGSVTLLVLAMLVAGCDNATVPSTAPGSPPASGLATPGPTGGADGTTASAKPSPSPSAAPVAPLGGLVPGALAVTVTDDLRVRSAPRVAEASLRYSPLLARGTPLVVMAGPVRASGYDWYRVAPAGVTFDGDVTDGWVAAADHDGTPWIALADDPTPGYKLAVATVDRGSPSVADARTAAASIEGFGVDLYRRMVTDKQLGFADKGMVFSPASVSMALGMARAGARGDTATEMDRVLRAGGWPSFGAGLNSLDQLLRSRDASWQDEEQVTHTLALRTANTAFAQEGWAIKQAYLDRIARTFGSGVGLLDYINDPEAARNAINGWVSRQTVGRIPTLLGRGQVSAATRLVLVNAVYLKANWVREFNDQLRDRAFSRLDGSTIKVPTMELFGEQDVVLAKGDGWQATELRYLDADGKTPLAMTLVLPDNLRTFEKGLSTGRLDTVRARIATERKRIEKLTGHDDGDLNCPTYPYNVHLFMPKFGIDSRADLVPVLQRMGMRLATSGGADFSGIATNGGLKIGMVVHQANIDVDQKGTEAAAATAVGMDTTGGCGPASPRRTLTLRLDKPFLFLIRDVQTGAILFMGRVVDPSQR